MAAFLQKSKKKIDKIWLSQFFFISFYYKD